MTRGADGLWTVTIPPQVVGFHYYTIVVDGAAIADPATRTFFGSDGITVASRFPIRTRRSPTTPERTCRTVR